MNIKQLNDTLIRPMVIENLFDTVLSVWTCMTITRLCSWPSYGLLEKTPLHRELLFRAVSVRCHKKVKIRTLQTTGRKRSFLGCVHLVRNLKMPYQLTWMNWWHFNTWWQKKGISGNRKIEVRMQEERGQGWKKGFLNGLWLKCWPHMDDLMCWEVVWAQTLADFVCQVKNFGLYSSDNWEVLIKQTLVSFNHNANFYELVDKAPFCS